LSDQNNGPLPTTISMPLDALAPWALLDSAQHTISGIANLLQFINQPELAKEVRDHAEALAVLRNGVLQQANSRIQLAGPGDVPRG